MDRSFGAGGFHQTPPLAMGSVVLCEAELLCLVLLIWLSVQSIVLWGAEAVGDAGAVCSG